MYVAGISTLMSWPSVVVEVQVASVEALRRQAALPFRVGFRESQPPRTVHGVDGVGDGEGIAVVSMTVGVL